MPEKTGETIQGEGRDGLLNLGAMRAHNLHLSLGKTRGSACGVCERGLEGVLETVQAPRADSEETPVDPGDGADEEGDPPPSPGSGSFYGDGQVLLPGF